MRNFLIIVICVIYVLSPIDFVPDLIPFIGWIDDLVAIAITVGMCTNGGTPPAKLPQ